MLLLFHASIMSGLIIDRSKLLVKPFEPGYTKGTIDKSLWNSFKLGSTKEHVKLKQNALSSIINSVINFLFRLLIFWHFLPSLSTIIILGHTFTILIMKSLLPKCKDFNFGLLPLFQVLVLQDYLITAGVWCSYYHNSLYSPHKMSFV